MSDAATATCPLHAGLERHIWPAGDGKGVVTKPSSDHIFGPDGLGLAGGMWATLLSYLARNGIQEQTGSAKDTTDIAACVKGWGQGAYSSRVFQPGVGVDQVQLERLISHLEAIAAEFNVPNKRITGKVLASFIATQVAEPYSTWNGMRTVKGFVAELEARFRGHVQWLGFDTLISQIDKAGVRHATPELIREFFNSEEAFFQRVVDRRTALNAGTLPFGSPTGLLEHVPDHIDREATDRHYARNKSGLWLILKITWYLIAPPKAKVGPLLERAPQ